MHPIRLTATSAIRQVSQSYSGKLVLLPALPAAFWDKGSVKGLKAVGNFTVDIAWEKARAAKVRIVSGAGSTCVVKYAGLAKDFIVTAGDGRSVAFRCAGGDEISFPTVRDGVYVLVPKHNPGRACKCR